MKKVTKVRKKKNPSKTFNSAILEVVDKNIAEQKILLKNKDSYSKYLQAPAMLDILKILKREFKSEYNDDYSNYILINELKYLFKELKDQVHEYGDLNWD